MVKCTWPRSAENFEPVLSRIKSNHHKYVPLITEAVNSTTVDGTAVFLKHAQKFGNYYVRSKTFKDIHIIILAMYLTGNTSEADVWRCASM